MFGGYKTIVFVICATAALGGLLFGLYAARAISQAGAPGSFCIVYNSEEEIGSRRARPWIEELARESRTAVILEPARPNGNLMNERKGLGRIEVAFPILDPKLKRRIMKEGLRPYLLDNSQSWEMEPDGRYRRRVSRAARHCAQETLLAEYSRSAL